MSNGPLYTRDESRDFGDEFKETTGTNIGLKRGLDVTLLGDNLLTYSNGTPIKFDKIVAAYPSSIVETYTYSLATVDQVTITVTYTNSTKELISTLEKTLAS